MGKSDALALNAARLEMGGRDGEKNVLQAIMHSGLGSLCYAIKSRVKSEERLIEKVTRKRKEKEKYDVDSVTDVIGIRLITLFRKEIPDIVREVLALIAHGKELSPNPFQKSCFEEIIIYTNAPHHDPFLAQLKEVLSQAGAAFELKESLEGYSSVHIVSRICSVAKLRTDYGEKKHPLPIEIQIRTVFEDAWGEIDHRFGYVQRAGKNSGTPIHNSALVQPHLKVLKHFTDACAHYADTILVSATTPLISKGEQGKIISVESDDDILKRFSELNVAANFITVYVEGRKLREEASKISLNQGAQHPQTVSAYIQAAEHFLQVRQAGERELSDGQGKAQYIYYARMNEALCLMSTEAPEYVQQAVELYTELADLYPSFPLAKFRLAQAVAKLGQTDPAIELYQSAEEAVEGIASVSHKTGHWPDELPLADYTHVSGALPKLLGYQLWKKAEYIGSLPDHDIEERTSLLYRAVMVTSKGLTARPDDIKIHNNFAYYATQYLELLGSLGGQPDSALHAQLSSSLSVLEHHTLSATNPDIFFLDTIAKAYQHLGRSDDAKSVAERIVQLVQEGGNQGEPEITLKILKNALTIK
ncbi:hypothetical protein SCD_n00117 [Sulfuricella denitrificans skB26]|uniref:RelA/SpoT domain-containing protein n=2 Tax=Sulfuricella denitrificans TaxID=649841 RepID=S6AE27_SULDS|nr:hypothetical protein SCD_n00117 [Sulfuricella denitrificans skB26]